MQRVTSDMTHFAPLMVAIRTKFLLALLGIATLDLDGEFRELLTHSVKTGAIAIGHCLQCQICHTLPERSVGIS